MRGSVKRQQGVGRVFQDCGRQRLVGLRRPALGVYEYQTVRQSAVDNSAASCSARQAISTSILLLLSLSLSLSQSHYYYTVTILITIAITVTMSFETTCILVIAIRMFIAMATT